MGHLKMKNVYLDAYIDYKTAYKLLKTTPRYIENILNRTEILSAKSGISFSLDDVSSDVKLKELVELLSSNDKS